MVQASASAQDKTTITNSTQKSANPTETPTPAVSEKTAEPTTPSISEGQTVIPAIDTAGPIESPAPDSGENTTEPTTPNISGEQTVAPAQCSIEPIETAAPDDSEKAVEPSPPDLSETQAVIPDIPNSEPPASPTDSETKGIPEILAKYYAKAPADASYFDLPETTTQLVVVDDTSGTIRVHFFERSDSEWTELTGLSAQAWGGGNGIKPKQREGDKVTPVGQFPILDAFYIDDKPETGLDAFHITNDTYWVDDPNSVFYNQHVEGTQNMDWNSAEHMISYPGSYKYGFVIGYNLDCIPGLGSAVFFHIAQRNTLGCVGVSEENCLKYLAKLDKGRSPYILIVSDIK